MLSYAILQIFAKVMKSYEIMPGGTPALPDLLHCFTCAKDIMIIVLFTKRD